MTTPSNLQPTAGTGNIPMPTQIIYVDRILNVGIGGSVCRLSLAVEVGENAFMPTAQLVIPTPALFEALEFMAGSISNNDEVKMKIADILTTFKDKLTKKS